MPTHTSFSTLIELLDHRAQHQPDQPVYTFLLDGETEEARLTHAALQQQARAVAATLQQQGIQAGERALLLYPPGLSYIVAFFGCLYAGVVAVPIYPPNPTRLERTLPRLQAIVEDAQPAAALTNSQVLSMVKFMLAQMPNFPPLTWLATDAAAPDAAAPDADAWQPLPITGERLAFLQYTSGSTASPKGVMLTHGNLLHNLALIRDAFGLTPQMRGVIWLPPYHDMGLIGGILAVLYMGGQVVLMSPLDFLKRPMRWLQAISRYRATVSGGPNFAYDLCVRKITPAEREQLDLSSWRLAFNGAEPVRLETLDRFAATFAASGFRRDSFFPCYGLAEATLIVSGGSQATSPVTAAVNSEALAQNRIETADATTADAQTLVSSGCVLPGYKIAIADPHTLHACPPAQVGEICLAGPSIAQGYWGQPETTAQMFGAHLADTGRGPFFRSGDLGFLHEGELFITGRAKDLIILRGRNLYPQDIELTVEQSHPALRPGCAAAFSIEADGGEQLVIVQEVQRNVQNLEADAVFQAMRQAASQQHQVRVSAMQLLKAGSIPKTPSGKIQRNACRAAFLADKLHAVATSHTRRTEEVAPAPAQASFVLSALGNVSDPSARQALLTVYLQEQIAEALDVSTAQVKPAEPVAGLGLDSLASVELQLKIEEQLGVSLSLAELQPGTTVAQVASEILAKMTRATA